METSESKSVAEATDNDLRSITRPSVTSLVAPNEAIIKIRVA